MIGKSVQPKAENSHKKMDSNGSKSVQNTIPKFKTPSKN